MKPELVMEPQHSCYVYKEDDIVLTIYSSKRKRLRYSEVNWHLDRAKEDVLEKRKK